MFAVCEDCMLGEVLHDSTCDDVRRDLAAEAGQGNRFVVSTIAALFLSPFLKVTVTQSLDPHVFFMLFGHIFR